MATVERRESTRPEEESTETRQENDAAVSAKTPKRKVFTADHVAEFFTYLGSIPPEEWSHLSLYLYRRWPVIVREKEDHNYIDKYGRPVSQDQILRQWGAGEYTLRLTDLNRSKFGEIANARLNLNKEDWDTYPPVLETAELDENHKENRAYIQWLRSKGLYKMAGAGNTEAAALGEAFKVLLSEFRARQQGTTTGLDAQAMTNMMAMFQAANKTALDMALSQVKQESPKDYLELLTKLKEFVAPPAAAPSESPMAMFREMVSTFREMTKATAPPAANPAAPAPNAVSQVKEMIELFGVMKETFGGGDSGPAPRGKWWGELAELALRQGPVAISQVANLIWALKSAPAAAGAVNPGGTLPTPQETLPAAAAGAEEARTMPANQEIQRQLAQYAPLILGALNRGETGDAFAESIAVMFGPLIYSQIAGLGKEGIIAALQSHPPLWQQLEPIAAQLEVFVDEFLEYGSAPPDDPGEESPPEEKKPRKPRSKPTVQ